MPVRTHQAISGAPEIPAACAGLFGRFRRALRCNCESLSLPLLTEAAIKRRTNRFDFGDSMTNRMFVVSPLAGALSLALSAPAPAAPAGEPMQATDLDKVEVIGQCVEKPAR